jgi:tetratricopeptide (TPR) repeat protein
MKHQSDSCPDLETIAAFLDGRLSERDREPIVAHLAGCERCYAIFTESAQTAPVSADAAATWWPPRRRVMWSSAAVLAAAAALVLAVRMNVAVDEPAPVQELVTAVGTDRIIEPRLSGGFAYGPRRTVRSGTASALTLSPDLRIAAARVEKDTAAQQSASARHARGVACVLTGNLECAVTSLQEPATQRPDDARILNDLAAVYLVRAEPQNDPGDLSRALATANRAIEIDRLLPEARFNRATALERLGMHTEAREAWQAYLTLDDRSGWADEARARLQALPPEP